MCAASRADPATTESFGDGSADDYACAPADVWAFGMVAFNVLTGRVPWDAATGADVSFRAYAARPRSFFARRFPLSRGAERIVRAALALDPARRATVHALRAAVASVDTFFLSDAELAFAPIEARIVAESYMPQAEDDEDAYDAPPSTPVDELPPHAHTTAVQNTPGPEDGEDSDTESEGPVTPETHAVEPVIDVPALKLCGEAAPRAPADVCAGPAGSRRPETVGKGVNAVVPRLRRVDVYLC